MTKGYIIHALRKDEDFPYILNHMCNAEFVKDIRRS